MLLAKVWQGSADGWESEGGAGGLGGWWVSTIVLFFLCYGPGQGGDGERGCGKIR